MSAIPDPWRSLSAEIRKIKEQLRRLGNASPFFGTGIRPTSSDDPDGVTIEGLLNVTSGEVQSGDFVPGASGWHLGSDGNAEFNDVTLRGILVGLDTPVQIQTYRSSAQAFSLTVPYVEKAGRDITVPDGCTRAKAMLMGRMYAVNPNTTGGADTTGTDALYFSVGIDGQFTTATPTGVSGGNGFATTVGMDSFDLAGLTPGSTVRLSVQGSSGYQSIASNPDNYIVGVAAITWLR